MAPQSYVVEAFVRLEYQYVQKFKYFDCTGQYFVIFQYVHDRIVLLCFILIIVIVSSKSDDRLGGLAWGHVWP